MHVVPRLDEFHPGLLQHFRYSLGFVAGASLELIPRHFLQQLLVAHFFLRELELELVDLALCIFDQPSEVFVGFLFLADFSFEGLDFDFCFVEGLLPFFNTFLPFYFSILSTL